MSFTCISLFFILYRVQLDTFLFTIEFYKYIILYASNQSSTFVVTVNRSTKSKVSHYTDVAISNTASWLDHWLIMSFLMLYSLFEKFNLLK